MGACPLYSPSLIALVTIVFKTMTDLLLLILMTFSPLRLLLPQLPFPFCFHALATLCKLVFEKGYVNKAYYHHHYYYYYNHNSKHPVCDNTVKIKMI